MDMYQIDGARPLSGTVRISGSKNACLPVLMATLLSEEPSFIEGVPDLRDITEMRHLIEHLGAKVSFENGRMVIDPSGVSADLVPYEIMRKMRASFYAMGPMLARLGKARLSLPGGCAIGDRPVDIHLRGFKAMGAQLARNAGYVHARAIDGLQGSRFSLMGPAGTSVGATCNVLMAATLAKGTTIIDDAAREPEVVELANFLIAMGAKIEGQGTGTIRIEGVERMNGASWKICPDRIEAATYAIAALITHGDVILENVERHALGSTLHVFEQWGAELTWPQNDVLRVRRTKGPKRSMHVVTEPYPGFPTDAQSPLTSLLCVTPGESVLRDTIYPERFMHVPELKRLGAKIKSPEKGRIEITGVGALEGAAVMASDLRAGAALVVAALGAHGTSQVRRIYHVERGYENLEAKLTALGASIKRIAETTEDPGQDAVVFAADNPEPLVHDSMDAIAPARLVDPN